MREVKYNHFVVAFRIGMKYVQQTKEGLYRCENELQFSVLFLIIFGKGEEWANLGHFVEEFISASHWQKGTEEKRNSWVNLVTCQRKKLPKQGEKGKIDKTVMEDETFDLTLLYIRDHYEASYKTVKEPDI